MIINIRAIEPTTHRLQMVKLFKDFTGLGLKESKDLVFNINYNLGKTFIVNLLSGFDDRGLRDNLESISGRFDINGGVQHERNWKLLEIGIGSSDDLADFISEYIAYKLYNKSISEYIDFLKPIFSVLSKEESQKIFKTLTK